MQDTGNKRREESDGTATSDGSMLWTGHSRDVRSLMRQSSVMPEKHGGKYEKYTYHTTATILSLALKERSNYLAR